MYLTVHALTGALIGKEITNPLFAFILGFLSHFILDIIPHAEPEIIDKDKNRLSPNINFKKVFGIFLIDASILAISLTIILTILFGQNIIINGQSIILGVLGSVLPDFLNGVYLLSKGKFLKKFFRVHRLIHFSPEKKPISLFSGTAIQLIIAIISLNFLL